MKVEMKITVATIPLLLASSGIALGANLIQECGDLQYALAKTVNLGPPDRWDYVYYDGAADRVYITHQTQVDVVDGASGAVVGRLKNINGAHGSVIVPELHRGFAANGQSGKVAMFDTTTFQTLKMIPADRGTDGLTYDAETGLVAAANGDARDVSLIDAKSGTRVANIALGGDPEGLIADGQGTLYVNIEDKQQLAAVSLKQRKVSNTWSLPDCEAPHGIAVDVKAHRIFVSCRNDKMQVVNADDGSIQDSLPIGHGTDSAAFDPDRHLAFSSNYDGTLSVISEQSPNRFSVVCNLKTAPGARTMAEDPASGRIFLVTADTQQTEPAATDGSKRYLFAPGTVKLLIVAPASQH